MSEKNYTVEEVIGGTIKILEEITIPAKLAEEVGMPIKYAIGNLQAVIRAIRAETEKPEEKKTEEVNPDGAADH